ncbi:MAG: zinc-binding alcohol dehydrogenase family protein [Alphaproteobacteria bacterium]
MKAVGYTKSLPLTESNALEDIELPMPKVGNNDLLVRVEAVSVNPVDAKVRMRKEPESGHAVLGFDAVGVVEETGGGVTGFVKGDKVFYAGDITRPGTNAQYHAVDARLVGRAPKSLSATEAASLPLTSITAWEMLFDCFKLKEGDGEGDAILVIGGAGGVGSILIQLVKALTGLRVIATASRPDTREWCLEMGADEVVDHTRPLDEEMARLGIQPKYVAALTRTADHFDSIVALLKPRGEVCVIDDPGTLDVVKMKQKALSFHWEFMFTRSMFQTEDQKVQSDLLCRVAELVDQGRIKPTVKRVLPAMNAATLKEAHGIQESGTAIGKTVLPVE